MQTKYDLSTMFIHSGRQKRFSQGSVNPVLQRASSLLFDSIEDKKHATQHRAKGELFYGRRGTLTHFALQDLMCEMEGGGRLLSLSLWYSSSN
nr:Cystathionine beta-lyase MetC [Haemophilus influenzae]